ncbi:MAG TPA: tripartite tricarboxylate transporter TctB family protein [Micromonosporaceae bacterium]
MISRITRQGQDRSEFLVVLFLLALGVLVLVDAARLHSGVGQREPVGPQAVPFLVGGLLVVTAVLLARDILRGGHGEPEGGEDVDLSHGNDWQALLLLSAAFLANIALIERAGWPISGAVLFFGCAYALGSRHFVRDPIIALVLSIGTWYLFVLGLGIGLPVGILKGIL